MTVKGRNLIALYELLLSHKLARIIESDTQFDDPAEEVHVNLIQVVQAPMTAP